MNTISSTGVGDRSTGDKPPFQHVNDSSTPNLSSLKSAGESYLITSVMGTLITLPSSVGTSIAPPVSAYTEEHISTFKTLLVMQKTASASAHWGQPEVY